MLSSGVSVSNLKASLSVMHMQALLNCPVMSNHTASCSSLLSSTVLLSSSCLWRFNHAAGYLACSYFPKIGSSSFSKSSSACIPPYGPPDGGASSFTINLPSSWCSMPWYAISIIPPPQSTTPYCRLVNAPCLSFWCRTYKAAHSGYRTILSCLWVVGSHKPVYRETTINLIYLAHVQYSH